MSALLLDQISSLSGKVGALVSLTCNVSSIAIPSPAQLSTKKWKEYMARKPKVITVPEIDLKGESCRYYFLLQGNGSGGCKATLIHSATQINGMATLAAVNRMLKTNAGETESSFPIDDFIESLPRFCGKQIVQREKKLSHLQASALKEYLKRKKLTEQPPVISTGELKSLLELTRECFLDLWRTNLSESVLQKAANKTSSHTVASDRCCAGRRRCGARRGECALRRTSGARPPPSTTSTRGTSTAAMCPWSSTGASSASSPTWRPNEERPR